MHLPSRDRDRDGADDPVTPSTVQAALGDLHRHLGRLEVVASTGSTSSDLGAGAAAAPGRWPDRSVLVADHQGAGRGRAGRTWTTPPGTALTFSVLLRPGLPVDRLGWLPLLTGLAVVQALEAVTALRAGVKWPNDVLVTDPGGEPVPGWGRRRKVAGVLSEVVLAPEPAVVLGIGLNVHQEVTELPVPSAASLRSLGHPVSRPGLLAVVLGRLLEVTGRWRAADGDPVASGLAAECAAACTTLGTDVVVELPGGEVLRGTAVGLAPDGALEVRTASGVRPVLAGDVRLRAGDGGAR